MKTLSVPEVEHLLKVPEQMTINVETNQEFVDWAIAHNTHNRAIMPEKIREYVGKIERGEWMLTSQGIAFAKGGWLSNGQHRLLAIRKKGYPALPISVTFGERNDAQLNIDEVTNRKYADAIALKTGQKMPVSKAAVFSWLNRMENRLFITHKLSKQEVLDMHARYGESVDICWRGSSRGMRNSAFFAPIAYLHYHGVPTEKLISFREGCLEGEGLSKHSPELTWRAKCLESKVPQTAYEIFASTCTALKASLEQRPLKIIKVFGLAKREQSDGFRMYIDWLDELASHYGIEKRGAPSCSTETE